MSHQKTNTTNNTKHNKQSHKRHIVSLVFKWGSLIGISLPSVGANNTSPFVAGDVEFRPNEFTGGITNSWASVPYCATDFPPYGNTATDHLTTVHNPVLGIGDICRHMGVIDSTNWRMPTQSEWIELYGSDQINGGDAEPHGAFGEGSFTPLSGYAFGAHQSNVAIMSDTEVTNADPYINGAVFLPASGFREVSNGAIWRIGSYGLCWSSTASTIDNGYYIGFYSTTVYPQWSDTRTYGFPIRCIRE